MKIIIFTNFFPKISETFTLNRITRLIDSGIDIKIFAIKNPAIVKACEDNFLETIVHPDVDKYHLMDLVQYFPKNSGGFLNYEIIKDAIDRYNPDIVHIQWGNLGEDLLSNIVFSDPTMVTFHSYIAPRTWKVVDQGFDAVFKKARFILPVSNYIREGLIKMGCDPAKVIVHHMGVDTKKFSPKQKLETEIISLLSVGSFIEKKGFQDALQAVGLLPKEILKNIRYHIVGDGPMKDEYLKMIQQYRLENVVSFLGKLTQDKVIEQYQSSDIYLHPSVMSSEGDDEGIPTVIMEAQACGLPIISTMHTGIPEIVKHAESGYLSEEHDIMDLRDNLTKLITDRDKRMKMGECGREIVLDDFNVDKLNHEMIEIYKNILN